MSVWWGYCGIFITQVPFPDNPCMAYSSTWYIFIFMYHTYHSNVNVYLIHEAQYLATSVHLQHVFIYMVYGVLLVFMFNCFFMYPLGFHRVILEAAWCQRVVPPTEQLQAPLPLREELGWIWWWVRDPYRWWVVVCIYNRRRNLQICSSGILQIFSRFVAATFSNLARFVFFGWSDNDYHHG